MALFTDIEHQVAVLRDLFGDDVEADELTARMSAFADDRVVNVLKSAAALARLCERISVVGAGVAANRSRREDGQDGLAQARGHRSAAGLMQDLSGMSRAEAHRQTRLGSSLLEGTKPVSEADAAEPSADGELAPSCQPAPRAPWHEPMATAMLAGRLSATQHDAILRGLGDPPDDSGDTCEAWRAAAEQLIDEAQERAVEELRIGARAIRDQLDPEGAARRFAERYERRSFRMWIDADGIERGSFALEDGGSAWLRAIIDAALRPRRGGPRFVDSAEKARAADLAADTRSNDQLSYDLIFDVLRAGALADADTVFGTRQAGVRLVKIIDASGDSISARTEDYGFPIPTSAAEQHVCTTGIVPVTVDAAGNPLNVGREHRLFTTTQRVALAIRDGGCRWKGCDRPASYCEAHHIDEWHADHGRTDIDRGILLCRHHHMQLHHSRWRITRDGRDGFQLHPPDGAPPFPLKPRAALTYDWGDIGVSTTCFRSASG